VNKVSTIDVKLPHCVKATLLSFCFDDIMWNCMSFMFFCKDSNKCSIVESLETSLVSV
jgi:hypothetical protein